MREGANAPVAPKRGASMSDTTTTISVGLSIDQAQRLVAALRLLEDVDKSNGYEAEVYETRALRSLIENEIGDD
jgi:hypothetical protein